MLGVTVQLPARKTLFPVQIARNREMLRLFWVMWIYYKDTCEVRSQDSVSWFAQSCSAHNGNIVQNKAATLLSEQSAMLMIQFFVISAVFLWLCFSCQPPLFSFFSHVLLPQGFCVFSFLWVLLNLLFYIQALFQYTDM